MDLEFSENEVPEKDLVSGIMNQMQKENEKLLGLLDKLGKEAAVETNKT